MSRKFVLAVLAGMLLAGCSKPKPVVDGLCHPGQDCTITDRGPIIVPMMKGDVAQMALPPHEAQVYAELWKVCSAKHLKYQVICLQDLGCNAWAWDAKSKFGFVPMWVGYSDDGPTASAEMLLNALKGQPNDTPSEEYYYKPPQTRFDTGEVRP